MVFIDEISDERNYFFHVVKEQVYKFINACTGN